MSGTRPAGPASGALAGQYPSPAMGHPLLMGPALFDDFRWNTVVQPWVVTTITTAPSWTPQTAAGAIGIRQIQTAASANTGGVLRMGASATDMPDCPTPGQSYAARVRITSTQADTVLWTGFNSSITATPATANNVRFIGFRAVNGAIEGVCKNGAGAGAETVVAMGIDLSTWRNLGFDVVEVGGAPAVQFWYADTSNRFEIVRTDVGAPVTTNLPSGFELYLIALGLTTTTAAARQAQIDFVSHAGRSAR